MGLTGKRENDETATPAYACSTRRQALLFSGEQIVVINPADTNQPVSASVLLNRHAKSGIQIGRTGRSRAVLRIRLMFKYHS